MADAGIGEAAAVGAGAKGASEALAPAALGAFAGNEALTAATGGDPFSPTSLLGSTVSAVAPGISSDIGGALSGLGGAAGSAGSDAFTQAATNAATSGVLGDVGANLTGVGAGLGSGSGAAGIAGITGDAALGSIGAGVGSDIASSALPALESTAAGASGIGGDVASLGGAGADLSGGVNAVANSSALGTTGVGGTVGGGSASGAPVASSANTGSSFLPANNSIAPISNDTAQTLGISNNPYGFTTGAADTAGTPISQGGGLVGSSTSGVPQAAGNAARASGVGDVAHANFFDNAINWITNNPGKALQYGLLAKNAVTLPSALGRANAASGTLQANANAAQGYANPMLANGGALSAPQQQALQDQFQQQLQQGIAQIQQNAIAAGQDPASSIVQQRVQQLKQQLTTQLESAQMQQQQANMSNALSALGISNNAAGAVTGQQYAQNKDAQATLNQTGQLVSQLNSLGG